MRLPGLPRRINVRQARLSIAVGAMRTLAGTRTDRAGRTRRVADFGALRDRGAAVFDNLQLAAVATSPYASHDARRTGIPTCSCARA